MLRALIVAASCVGCAGMPAPQLAGDHWAPLRPLLGRFVGEGAGEPGRSTVEREYRPILGQFLLATNRSIYAPKAKNPKGEVHENWDILSWDRRRKAFVLRQFHTNFSVASARASPRTLSYARGGEGLGPFCRARSY